MPPRQRGLTDSERADWAHVARGVMPLPGRLVSTVTAPDPQPVALPPALPAATTHHTMTRMPARPAPRATPAAVDIGHEPGGLDRASWLRFRGGKVPAARRLDLHGMTTQRAFHALIGFLRAAHADRLRCVEVITGRGSGDGAGSIRREFPIWLNLPDIRPMILAASHPHPANPGSVRLLLRRPR